MQQPKYPDRTADMIFLQSVVEKLINDGDYELASFNFAKLVEAMRQQNINLGFALNDVFENTVALYESFRREHDLIYPAEFSENIEHELKATAQNDNSTALKKATELSGKEIEQAILLVREVLKADPKSHPVHKKLASYLQLANRFQEAKDHLIAVTNSCSIFEKSLLLDHLAVIHKKQKLNDWAMLYDAHAVYFRTMYNAPIAYNGIDSYYNSIALSRKYPMKELILLVNIQMKLFWGKDWLESYLQLYKQIWNNRRASPHQFETSLLGGLGHLIEQKPFLNFNGFVTKLIFGE
jgi:hypothetical protein